ncbi:MAG: uroporphyrinogen decarboxylase, partial [Oscillospiraceae bacterium]|nr:uroporphyrinogen decarboxylase [Oscillospiraceae bacterium]
MHKDDQMTPRERAAALAKGESVDRMPIAMFYFAPSHRLVGWDADALFMDARHHAELAKASYLRYGMDGVTSKYGLHSMGITYGATVLNPKDGSRA